MISNSHFAVALIVSLFAIANVRADDAVAVGRIAVVSSQAPVAAINVGADAGVRENDRAVILRDGDVVATGLVNHLQTDRCGLEFTLTGDRTPIVGDKVIVVRGVYAAKPSESCELILFKTALVDRVLPAGDRLWIAGGERDGWRRGDSVLVRRGAAVLGWGMVANCYDRSALVTLDRTREDGALPRRGDAIEAIGKVGRSDRVRSRVAAIVATGDTPRMIVAGDSHSGFALDDRVEIIRDGCYVSYGKVVGVDPLLQIEANRAFQRTDPQEGDTVTLRGDVEGVEPAVGRIFRVEKDYALITLGQVDQIENDQRLFILNHDGSTTSLKVRKLYAEHCGATLDGPDNRDPDAKESTLQNWMPVSTFSGAAARREVPCAEPLAEDAGKLPDWLASLKPEGYCLPKVGETVARSYDGSSWMVIAVGDDEILAVKVASNDS